MSRRNLAIIELLLCSALWSIAGIFIKLIPWSGIAIAGARSLFAGSVAAVYMYSQRQRLVLSKKSLLGGVGLGTTLVLFCCANKLTTSANAIVLQFTAPVFIVIFSAVFFGKRFKKSDLVVVAVTLLGISLFFFDRLSPGHLLGNILGILAGVAFAWFYISLEGSSECEHTSSLIIGNSLTFLVGLPFILMERPEVFSLPVLYIVILGVLQLGIPYVLLARAAVHCSPLVCSLLGALEPLLNPLWVLIFDGEKPGAFALAGGAIVIAAITIWCIYDAKQEVNN